MDTRSDHGPVVIVEDDTAVRESLTMLVEAAGYDVRAFESAAELLAAGAHEQAACLILDVRLAGMSGVELHEKLVRDGASPPAIFLSGHGPSEVSAEAHRHGVVAVFEKPCSPDALIDAIGEAVARASRPRT